MFFALSEWVPGLGRKNTEIKPPYLVIRGASVNITRVDVDSGPLPKVVSVSLFQESLRSSSLSA